MRIEKGNVAEKLRQKEMLERELANERQLLQEQLIKQAKLSEIIKEKDKFEEELKNQRDTLQVRDGLLFTGYTGLKSSALL